MTQFIFFDIGNVLIHFCHDKMFTQVAKLCQLPKEIIHEETINKGIGNLYETGTLNTQELFSHFLKLSNISFTHQEFTQAISDIFSPNETIVPIIEQLRHLGIPLGLLSNTNEAHFQFLEDSYPMIKTFDRRILSYQIKLRKPDSAIFKAALEMAGCSPSECFYTDDIQDYVDAARRIGIDAELFQGTEALAKQLQKRKVLRTFR